MTTDFDARANLFSVVRSILAGDKPSQELLDEADRALEQTKAQDGTTPENCSRCHGTGWVGLPSGWVTRVGFETMPCPDCEDVERAAPSQFAPGASDDP